MKVLLVLATILLPMVLGKKKHARTLGDTDFESFTAAMKESMDASFKASELVPDVIDKLPDHTLKIRYCVNVALGNTLEPVIVKGKPTSIMWKVDPNKFYTLAMIDPDAPSRKDHHSREWHHWLVGNIPGKQIPKGDVLSDYIGSAPPKGTGFHRYAFLVYEQPDKITFDEPRLTNASSEHRANFSMKKFAEKYKLGNPVAGNYFQSESDQYSEKLHETSKPKKT